MIRAEKTAVAQFIEAAMRVAWVEITLRDGRTLEGSVIDNPFRNTGLIINPITEQRHDFSIDDVVRVREVGDPRSVDIDLNDEP